MYTAIVTITWKAYIIQLATVHMENSHECTVLWVSLTKVPGEIENAYTQGTVRQCLLSMACKYGEYASLLSPYMVIAFNCLC